jgi:CDP-diacylglycerol---glycerol-3-phosphate 3-phosphatidyltransferase
MKLNLANKLTILRIFMIPVFMIFLLNRIPYGVSIAALIFVIAALTDTLDGYMPEKEIKSQPRKVYGPTGG